MASMKIKRDPITLAKNRQEKLEKRLKIIQEVIDEARAEIVECNAVQEGEDEWDEEIDRDFEDSEVLKMRREYLEERCRHMTVLYLMVEDDKKEVDKIISKNIERKFKHQKLQLRP